jgi:hypothetical protein
MFVPPHCCGSEGESPDNHYLRQSLGYTGLL